MIVPNKCIIRARKTLPTPHSDVSNSQPACRFEKIPTPKGRTFSTLFDKGCQVQPSEVKWIQRDAKKEANISDEFYTNKKT
jgi:hypothetical protein